MATYSLLNNYIYVALYNIILHSTIINLRLYYMWCPYKCDAVLWLSLSHIDTTSISMARTKLRIYLNMDTVLVVTSYLCNVVQFYDSSN